MVVMRMVNPQRNPHTRTSGFSNPLAMFPIVGTCLLPCDPYHSYASHGRGMVTPTFLLPPFHFGGGSSLATELLPRLAQMVERLYTVAYGCEAVGTGQEGHTGLAVCQVKLKTCAPAGKPTSQSDFGACPSHPKLSQPRGVASTNASH